jgi:hypothetical protein
VFVTHDSAQIRHAGSGDAEAVGRLLHDFNSEFGEPTASAKRSEEDIAARKT